MRQGLLNVLFGGFVSHHLKKYLLVIISPFLLGDVQLGPLPTPVGHGKTKTCPSPVIAAKAPKEAWNLLRSVASGELPEAFGHLNHQKWGEARVLYGQLGDITRNHGNWISQPKYGVNPWAADSNGYGLWGLFIYLQNLAYVEMGWGLTS